MPVTQYDIAPLTGASLWGYFERATTMRLATVTGRQAIEVSPILFVVRLETIYFPYEFVPDRVEGWDQRLLPPPPIMERRVLPPHQRNSD